MRDLTFCPRCHDKLKVSENGNTYYCTNCKYWTKVRPVRRRDSIFFD